MATSNARIQFSTAEEKTWKSINPMLREGELVIAKKPSGKYRLYVGATGGSKFNDSVVVWDEELADSYSKSAAMSASQATGSKSAAAASASYAAQSMSAAKTSADAAAQSMSAAKTSADAAAQSMNAAKASADAAEQSKTSAALSSNKAAENMRKAEDSANKSETAATNAISSANSASQSETNAINAKNESNKSASNAKISETNAKASEKAAAISAGAVSYATQEEVNAGVEAKKIVSPKTLKNFGDTKYLPSSGGTLTGNVNTTADLIKTAQNIDINESGASARESVLVRGTDKNNVDVARLNMQVNVAGNIRKLQTRVINKGWSDFRICQTDDGKFWCELVGGEGTTLSISPNSNNNTVPTTEWVNTFIGNYIMRGASANANGAAGIVPEPKKGQQNKYLCADGTWSMPPNTTYSTATQTKDGLMSSADKKILDDVNTNPWFLDYLSRFGYNYVPPVQNAARIKLGVFKSFYNKFVLKNQPTQYGHLLSLPDAYNGVECFEIWISAPDGAIYTRAGNASKAINDQQFLKLVNAKEFTECMTWKKAFTGNAAGSNVNLCTLPATWNEMYIVYKHNRVEYISSGVINKAQKGVTIWTLADDEDKAIRYTVNASNEVILISRGQGNSSIKEVWYR